jgi:hypothetical protein
MVQSFMNKIFQEVGIMDLSKESTYEKKWGEKQTSVMIERCYKGEASVKELVLSLLKKRLEAGGRD